MLLCSKLSQQDIDRLTEVALTQPKIDRSFMYIVSSYDQINDKMYLIVDYDKMSGDHHIRVFDIKSGLLIFFAYHSHRSNFNCFLNDDGNLVINRIYETNLDSMGDEKKVITTRGICYKMETASELQNSLDNSNNVQGLATGGDNTQGLATGGDNAQGLATNLKKMEEELGFYVELNKMDFHSEIESPSHSAYKELLKYAK
jgi:hypothetical protein